MQNWAAGDKVLGRVPVFLTKGLGQGAPLSQSMRVGSPH